MDKAFKALVVSETGDGSYKREITKKRIGDLPEGDVLVWVGYSSLNYKDALSASGNRGVTRKYPHTPGIDAAGVVEESRSNLFRPGDTVIVTSYDLGMNTPGGFGEYIRVPESWVVPLPAGMTARQSMMFGTAGFTAALSVYRMMAAGVKPGTGEVLVTGASGGVGSIAVAILTREGYDVAAVNGRKDETEYLKSLGAKTVISASEAGPPDSPPLLKERWAGCIDTVGGDILANAIKATRHNGVVTCCGNAMSHQLPLNVYPFILRGVTLIGIDSQQCPMPLRREIWNAIGGKWSGIGIEKFVMEIPLDKVGDAIENMLSGKHRGRTLVNLAADRQP
jgi:putative YhdH/YhfP family quinone oxidoreductase